MLPVSIQWQQCQQSSTNLLCLLPLFSGVCRHRVPLTKLHHSLCHSLHCLLALLSLSFSHFHSFCFIRSPINHMAANAAVAASAQHILYKPQYSFALINSWWGLVIEREREKENEQYRHFVYLSLPAVISQKQEEKEQENECQFGKSGGQTEKIVCDVVWWWLLTPPSRSTKAKLLISPH